MRGREGAARARCPGLRGLAGGGTHGPRARFGSHPYDENVSQGVMYQSTAIELGLYRVRVDELRARRRAPER